MIVQEPTTGIRKDQTLTLTGEVLCLATPSHSESNILRTPCWAPPRAMPQKLAPAPPVLNTNTQLQSTMQIVIITDFAPQHLVFRLQPELRLRLWQAD